MIFDPVDLRNGGSKAKFDVEVDGEVHFPVAPPKPSENRDKPIFCSKNFAETNFFRRKTKRWESSETRFGKVSGQTEPSSGGKRPFKVCDFFFRFCVFGIFVASKRRTELNL